MDKVKTEKVEVKKEVFEFNGKEYKTEAAMKAAMTKAEKAEEVVVEKTEIKLTVKHNGKLFRKGEFYELNSETLKVFQNIGVI